MATSILIPCSNPDCRQTLECSGDLMGKEVQCPSCGAKTTVPAKAPTPSATTQRLGNYTLVSKLGEGGMGTVYVAIQDGLQRKVALKVLNRRLASDPIALERFKREAQAAAALDHPNIVQVYDIGQDRGRVFFAMQLIEGENLGQRLKREGKLPVSEALAIVAKVAQALDYAWTHGKIIHRDIKPDNIMLTSEGQVKVADLGLAKSIAVDSSVTAEGKGIGTPTYMAPEQGRAAKDVDCRADIYSLGITLFHILTGKEPFEGETAVAIMLAHTEDPLPNARQFNPEIPESVCLLLERMCAKAPADRYQNPADLLDALGKVQTGKPLETQMPSARLRRTSESLSSDNGKPRSRVMFLGALGFAALVLIGAGVYFVTRTGPAPSLKTRTTPDERARDLGNGPESTGSGGVAEHASPTTASPITATAGAANKTPSIVPEQPVRQPKEQPKVEQEGKTTGLEGMFNDAGTYAQAHLEEFAEVVRRFEAVQEKSQGTAFEPKARDHVNAWRAKWDSAAKKELSERQQEAERHIQAGRFADAEKLWEEFPDQLLTEATGPLVQQEVEKLPEKKNSFAADLGLQAKPLLAKKREALSEQEIKALSDLKDRGKALLPSLTGEHQETVASMLATIDDALKSPRSSKSGTREYNYEEFWSKYRELIEGKKFDQATELTSAKVSSALPATMARHRSDALALKSIFERAQSNLGRLVDKSASIGGVEMKVVAFKEGRLCVKQGESEMAWSPERLDADEWLTLGLADEKDPKKAAYERSVFQFFWGSPSKIQKAFDEAKAVAVDVSFYESKLIPYLVITSIPESAQIKLDPQPAEPGLKLQTPLRLKVNKHTTYKIEVFKAGFKEAAQEVKVGLVGEYLVKVNLKKVSPESMRGILAWGRYSNREQEFARSIDILRKHFGGRVKISQDFSEKFDEEFGCYLMQSRTLLIPMIASGRVAGFKAAELGAQLKPFADTFLRRGANIVILGARGEHGPFFREAGLLDVQSSGGVGGSFILGPDAAKIGEGAPTNFDWPRNSYTYRLGPKYKFTVLLALSEESIVIAARQVGTGWIILIGFDYFSSNETTEKILINAITYR